MKINKRFSKRLNDSGVAMVSVMIVATVCLLVATIVLQLTYNSLLSRKVFSVASDTDSTAEAVVDDMEAVVQSIAAYTVGQIKNDGSKNFIQKATEVLLNSAGLGGAGITDFKTLTQDQRNSIANYMYGNLSEDYQKMFAEKDADGNPKKDATGKYVRDANLFKVYTTGATSKSETEKKDSLSIGVEFTYTNAKGFVSTVKTDLVMNDVTKRKGASDYGIGTYSMFTGGGVTISGCGDFNDKIGPTFVQEGNVYIGTMASDAPKACEIDGVTTYMTGAAIINGDVYLKNRGILNFTAGADAKGNRTEITIYGTVYIDSSSALVLNEGCNFMCKDIILVDDSGNKTSIFTGSKSYLSYDNSTTQTYGKMFPYEKVEDEANPGTFKAVLETDDLRWSGSNAIKATQYDSTYKQKNLGCVFIVDSNNQACIAQRSGSTWKKLKGNNESETSNILLNSDPTCTTKAKSSIWTYNNKVAQVDAEMANFINVKLLYAVDSKNGLVNGNTYASHKLTLLPSNGKPEIERNQTLSLNVGGSPIDGMSQIKDKAKTSDLTGISYDIDINDATGIALKTVTQNNVASITIKNDTFNTVSLKNGNIQDDGENIPDNAIVFGCGWSPYTVQQHGTAAGILISADKCTYSITTGKAVVTLYSILGLKDNAENAAKTQINNTIDYLQYVSRMKKQDSTQYSFGNGNWADSYQIGMLDSLFVGGVQAFLKDKDDSEPTGGYEFNSANMYDFITVENWQQY